MMFACNGSLAEAPFEDKTLSGIAVMLFVLHILQGREREREREGGRGREREGGREGERGKRKGYTRSFLESKLQKHI